MRQDGKRPDSTTILPWSRGRPLAWDVTAPCAYADAYVVNTAREAGAATNKNIKYSQLSNTHVFVPVAIETGYMAPSGGGTGTGDWNTDGQHYRRCQEVHLPVSAAVRGTTEGECGLISKHVHRQLACCKPLFHFLNVLVPTGFVLVGQKINK